MHVPKLGALTSPLRKSGRPDWIQNIQQRLNLGKKQQTLILEIGEDWIKLLGLVQAGQEKKITCLEAISINGANELLKSEKIGQFLKKNNFKPQYTYILHPSQNLTTRILSLPSTDPNEIKDIIALQAVKQTPYTKEEISTGFHIIDSDGTGYSRVFLAISHRDVASAYFRIGEFGGVSANQINISLEGVRSWYEAANLAKERETATVLLDVDWASTEVLILQGSKMIFSRSMSFGLKHLEERTMAVETEFLPELQRSLDAGAPELKGAVISRIILTGISKKIQDAVPVIARELSLPCEYVFNFQPFAEKVAQTLQDSIQKCSCSFAALLGFAFNPHPADINLIPSQIEAKKGLEDRAKDLAILGSLLLALVMLISVISFEKIYKKDQYLKYLKSEYSKIEAPAEEVERVVAKMKLASEQLNIGGNLLDVLYEITEVLPPNIYLTSVQYNALESNMVIRGMSEEMSAVFKLLSTLEAAPHLEFVKTRSVTKRKIDDKEMAEFEISAEIATSKQGSNPSPKVETASTEVSPAPAAETTETAAKSEPAPEVHVENGAEEQVK